MKANNPSPQVDLIWLGGSATSPDWHLGSVIEVEPTVSDLREAVGKHVQLSDERLLLFCDSRLRLPDASVITRVQAMRGDVWHAGLRLGLAGQPWLIHSVESTWLLNADPDPMIDSTSWRLSLRSALIPSRVLKRYDFIRPEFESLDAAALELGHRLMSHGVLMRHAPELIASDVETFLPEIPLRDQIRFIYARYGSFWVKWALMRAALNKKIGFGSFQRELKAGQVPLSKKLEPYRSRMDSTEQKIQDATVTVLIPTLDRYEYLRKLLGQLRQQTIKPLEILIIDQTEKERRDTLLAFDFKDLPLQVVYRDQAGQCSSRNAGLQMAKGEYILFLDDDSEIPDDLIEKHLKSIHLFQADSSSGVAEEVGAGPLPENFKLIRASDVFPTNNTLIHNSVLQRSGLFDLAYERGQRADGDLGMRVYLSGAFMVLNPEIRILHHHAPRGGLRAHKARVITYASSRNTLLHRHLPSTTEIYLAKRYFSPEILREMLWLRVAGTFSIRGSALKKAAKVLVSTVMLPHTLLEINRRMKEAAKMAQQYPQIPYPVGRTPDEKHESSCATPY
jgi:glycosyltransferase involved in cell wall biosynthesis